MRGRFFWDDWNTAHLEIHRVTKEEAEYVVRHSASPYPQGIGDEKLLVRGQTNAGRFLQVIYVFRSEVGLDFERMTLADILELVDEPLPLLYIIHARDLTRREKSKYRRRI